MNMIGSLWKSFQAAAKHLAAAWEDAILARLRALAGVLRQPDFWISLVWIVLASGALLGLAWFAIRQYDTFLRLRPVLCTKTLDNARLLVIVMVAPLSLVFTLVASSEFLALRKRRAPRGWAGSGYFWRYTILMLLSWLALLYAMRC
jgi:hypothetical protein